MSYPFNPQTVEELRARYPLAVKHPLLEGTSLSPKHIFDFLDGTRLIVTRDEKSCGNQGCQHSHTYIHMSAAIQPDSLIDGMRMEDFLLHASKKFMLLQPIPMIVSDTDRRPATVDDFPKPEFYQGHPQWWFPCELVTQKAG